MSIDLAPPPTTTGPSSSSTTSRSRRQVGRLPWPLITLFLLPALALYGVFVLYPIVQSARYSLYEWNGLEPLTKFVGFDNFRDAWDNEVFRTALSNNGILVLLSLAVQIPFALFLATLLNQKLRGRAIMRTLFFAPYVLSEVVTGVVWRQILRPGGLLDTSLTAAGGGGLIREWLGDPDVVLFSLFVVISWKYFGLHMVLLLAGLQQIPSELGEAAAVDGATPWQTFRYITLPLLGPTLRVSIFLSIIGALQLFDMVWVTTHGGPVNASSTMATYLYDQFRRGKFGYASAVSVIIFGLSLVIALLYQRFAMRRDLQGAGHA